MAVGEGGRGRRVSSESFSECIKQAQSACRRHLISACVGTTSDSPEQDQP